MATRYSGCVRIEIAYVDSRSQYKATVSERGQHRWSGWVRPPAAQKGSVDSAANYDDAAGAALSFAMDSVKDLDGSVAWPLDGSGTRPMLSRSAPRGSNAARGRSGGMRAVFGDDAIDMTPRYAPTSVMVAGGQTRPVLQAIVHPAGTHPKSPIRDDMKALELRTDRGARWYGVEDAYINAQLRMVVVGTPKGDEVRMKWAVVPVKFRAGGGGAGRSAGRSAGAAVVKWSSVVPYGETQPMLVGEKEGSRFWVEVFRGSSVAYIVRKMSENSRGGERVVREVTTNTGHVYEGDRGRALGIPGAGYAMEIGERLLSGKAR